MMLEDDEHKNELIDRWTMRKRVCVLGAGEKPLTEKTRNLFEGIGSGDIEATNVDIRKLPTTDIIQDLNKKHWSALNTNAYDVVIAEHVAEHMRDRLAFLDECRRIVRPYGKLIIEVPNWKHESAHNTLEHVTTWGRCIFNPCYITTGKYEVERVVYRMTYPFSWKSFYLDNEFIGRQLDRFTNKISGLRFHLKVIK